jgi:hypothetical protein
VAYFPDLSPYSYGHGHHSGVVHVGWLDGVHPFPTGSVEPALVEKLKALACKPVELYRGTHTCEVCTPPPDVGKPFADGKKLTDPESSWARWWKWADARSSNGEIRVADEHVVYAAPVLIVHYIEEHSYLPPSQFLESVARTK